jgi:hypothetical protein
MLAFSVPRGISAERAAGTAEARSVHRDHRLDPDLGAAVAVAIRILDVLQIERA